MTRKHRRHALPLASLAAIASLITTLAPVPVAVAATDCVSEVPSGPIQITADCVDPNFTTPVIDRQEDATTPVPHHRVSGHFEGTAIQFNVYLPPKSEWQGRFFQTTYPLTSAEAEARTIEFALASGGYAVQAGSDSVATVGYRHVAAAAKAAEQIAADFYDVDASTISGYLYGASGGSYQTIGAAENTQGVWEGFVPIVNGVPTSLPNNFFIRSMARLVLADKADLIRDAVMPGGSGDPYAVLDEAEAAMLRELVAFGIPLEAWEDPSYMLVLGSPDGMPGYGEFVQIFDPTYVDDFWTKPGYLGTEQSALGEAVRDALAAGGDRAGIAISSYYRHQLPPISDAYYTFDQFRDASGQPLYPQRAPLLAARLAGASSGGTAFDGSITGKMIIVDNLLDVDAPPWNGDWYAGRVEESLGAAANDSLRLYFNERADHVGPTTTERAAILIDSTGIVEQALRAIADWAENGVAAPASTRYAMDDGQVVVEGSAQERLGLQPSADLSVRNRDVVTIKAGQRVALKGMLQAAPGSGEVIRAEWDFEGDGTYVDAGLRSSGIDAKVSTTHVYTEPGTYFVSLRVTASAAGGSSELALMHNIDRVRVIVN